MKTPLFFLVVIFLSLQAKAQKDDTFENLWFALEHPKEVFTLDLTFSKDAL
ncbi:hypothetical protein [Mangrovimonas sp. TPBH4]|uniref:hypothetical protein n=1 Tax=Mangrovimonas sp. TPBH4 TaxID=1645914 RepID=UPI000B018E19|nr:hypothetical protein [Mangrovimonas sp. TPBH4]